MAKKPDRWRWLRWTALIGGGVADAVTTRDALKRPGTREANPLLRGIAKHFPTLLGVKVAANVGVAVLTDKMHDAGYTEEANIAAIGGGVAQAAIAVSNAQQGKKREEP